MNIKRGKEKRSGHTRKRKQRKRKHKAALLKKAEGRKKKPPANQGKDNSDEKEKEQTTEEPKREPEPEPKQEPEPQPGPSQPKRPTDRDSDVEFVCEVRSTYTSRREGIIRRREMKMEMETRQKQRYLHTYDPTKEGYMQWRRTMEMFAGDDMTDNEMDKTDKTVKLSLIHI